MIYGGGGNTSVRTAESSSIARLTAVLAGWPNCVCAGWMPMKYTSTRMLRRITSINRRGESVCVETTSESKCSGLNILIVPASAPKSMASITIRVCGAFLMIRWM